MSDTFEDEFDQVRIGVSASNSIECLDGHFFSFAQLTGDMIRSERLDLLFVLGASPLQTALVKSWCDETCCVAACVEGGSIENNSAEIVAVNIKRKLEGNEFPNNVDVSDVRRLADDDNQLIAFTDKTGLVEFLNGPAHESIRGILYLMHGEFCVDRFRDESQALKDGLSGNATLYYSYLSGGEGECTALVAVHRR